MSYHDISNNTLKVLHCNDANCDSALNGPESIASPDSPSIGGRYTSLKLDVNGFPVVSYYATGDLRILHCGSINCH